jgi:cation-transporting ATPase 13A1
MSVAAFFLFISWAKPLRRLSSKRPHSSVFHRSLLLSVAGQFIIHLATVAYAVSLATPYAKVDAALAEVGFAQPLSF